MKQAAFDTAAKAYTSKSKHGHIEVEVGDSKQPDFKPRVKLAYWDNECNVSFGLPGDSGSLAQDLKGRVQWHRDDGVKAVFYSLDDPAAGEDGGFEFEIHLPKKPDSNTIELTMNIPKGLEFYYQPPLTAEEIKDGCQRPDNVVGSYAVYHASKAGDYSPRGGKNYKTGKAFHIYRPEAWDSAGNRVWCDLDIDVDKQITTITVPQEWLDKAAYPVVVDPTFGYTGVGASWVYSLTICGSKFSMPENGTAKSIVVRARRNTSGTYMGTAIYSDNSGAVNIKLAEDTGDVELLGTENWYTSNISCEIAGDANYWLCLFTSKTAQVRYDTGSANQFFMGPSPTFENWPGTMPSSDYLTHKLSIYCIYEVAGEPQSFSADTMRRIARSQSVYSDTLRQVIKGIPVTLAADTLLKVIAAETISPDTLRRVLKDETVILDTLRRAALEQGLSVDTLRVAVATEMITVDTLRLAYRIINLGRVDLLAEFAPAVDLLAEWAEINLQGSFVPSMGLLAEDLTVNLQGQFSVSVDLEGDVSKMMEGQDFSVVPGDDVELNFTITMPDGESLNDAQAVVFSIHRGTIIKTLSRGITVTGADVFKVELTAEDTTRLTVPSSYSIRVVNATGKTHTVASGTCTPVLI